MLNQMEYRAIQLVEEFYHDNPQNITKQEYIEKKHDFIIEKLLKEFSYDEVLKFSLDFKEYDIEKFKNKFFPCESNGQCRMDCVRYLNCD